MKIVVENGKARLVHKHEKNAQNINAFIKELKTMLGVDWVGLCPIYGLASNETSVTLIRNWRHGKKEMPEQHWQTTLQALNLIDRCEVKQL
ncbi:hypothetical protein F7U66_01490 [Vibrio parahaemolyticus]|nr:hypothetical protein [Vibrio parahaemolyticus]